MYKSFARQGCGVYNSQWTKHVKQKEILHVAWCYVGL